MGQLTAVPPATLSEAGQVAVDVAGAESTVALHLARFGVPTAWVSRLGADPFGQRIRALLERYGVDTRFVEVDPGRPTGVYFKDPSPEGTAVYYYRAGSAASAMAPRIITDDLLDGAPLVHLTGITTALSESCRATVEELLRKASRTACPISFDVNHRPKLWRDRDAAAELLELANRADIVFVGLDEAEALWDTATPASVRTLLGRPREVVVKDGANGATLFLDHEELFEPAWQVDVVEPVGAGDSFAAGYLYERLAGRDGRARLRSGHRLAAAALGTTADFAEL